MPKKVNESAKTISAEKIAAIKGTVEVLSAVRRPEAVEGLDMQCLLKLVTPTAANGRPAEEPYAIIPLAAKKDWFYIVYPDGTLQTKYTIVGNLVIGEGLVYPQGNQVVVEPDGSKRSPQCFTASVSRNVSETNSVGMATQAALSMALGNAGFQTPAYVEYDAEKCILLRTDDTRLDESLDAERGTQLFGTPATSDDTAAGKGKKGKGEFKAAPASPVQTPEPAPAVTSAPEATPAPEEPSPIVAPSTPSSPEMKGDAEATDGAEPEQGKIPETLEEALATVITLPGGLRGRTMKEVVASAPSANNARRRLDRLTDKQYISRQGGNTSEEGEEMFLAEQAAIKIIYENDLESLVESLRGNI